MGQPLVTIHCRRHPGPPAPGCPYCELRDRPLDPARLIVPAAAGPPPGRAACLFEGPVLEQASCGNDLFHVRECRCDAPADPDREDRCTRGANNGDLPSCASCPDWRPASLGPPPLRVLFTGGIGDCLTVEALLAPEERDRLTAVYYACPAARTLEGLFRAVAGTPGPFPRLTEHVVFPTGRRVFYTKAEVEAQAGPLPADVLDLSIYPVFTGGGRRFAGSSFLARPWPWPPLPKPEGPFVVVVPHSTFGQWQGRDFTPEDWDVCLGTLERHGLAGVVLGVPKDGARVPAHPRLSDWQGRTGMLGSVAVMQRAAGYLGISSALSVLAAQLHPAQRLSVKGSDPHLLRWKHLYYAPRTEFGWLNPRLVPPDWE